MASGNRGSGRDLYRTVRSNAGRANVPGGYVQLEYWCKTASDIKSSAITAHGQGAPAFDLRPERLNASKWKR